MSELKGTYYYFVDLVDKNSIDYDKIVIVKANNDTVAWRELSNRHVKQYGRTNQPIEAMYKFLEKKEIS